MPINLTFVFYGEAQVDRTLDRRLELMRDMRPLWDVLAKSFARMEKAQFNSEGSAGNGAPWPALGAKYAAWKQRHYPKQPIMRRSDDLYNSLTKEPFGIDIRELNFAIFGSAVEYGVFHQKGAGNLPVRKVINMSESLRRRWVKLIQRYLVTGLAGD